jgi:hypothetical protein
MPLEDDFVSGTLKELPTPMKLDGIAGSLMATKTGTMRHTVLSDSGTEEVLEMMGVYMPGLETRLISPQLYLQQLAVAGKGKGQYIVESDLSFLRLPNKKVITLGYDPVTRLPMLTCFRNIDATASGLAMTCLTDKNNQNLSFQQKMLLQFHYRTGHLGFQPLQWLGRKGFFGDKGEKFGLSSVSPPKCAACQYGKQQRRPIAGSTTKKGPEHTGILKKDAMGPGDIIFGDQLESCTPGHVFRLQGAHISSQRYCGGSLYTDAYSGFIFFKTSHC